MDPLTKSKPAIMLAPMEGVTDFPMRRLLTEIPGLTHAVAEFLRISVNVPPDRIYLEHMPELKNQSRTPSGVPVIFQLLGGHEEKLASAAQQAVRLGACGIDLNFGCPAPTVNRHDGGATLLKYPERIYGIIRAVRSALPHSVPVSAKFRLGWDSHKPIYKNAEQAVLAGASWITIHGRTKIAGYRPPAYWSEIGELNRSLPIPVVANGDIWTIDDFKKCQDETHCVHYMLGRGAVVNPYLPAQIAQELKLDQKTDEPPQPNLEQWKHYFNRLIDFSMEVTDCREYPLCRVKQWSKMIFLRGNFEFYNQIKILKTLEEFWALNAPGPSPAIQSHPV